MPFIWMLLVWGLLGNGMMEKLPVAWVDADSTTMSRNIGLELSSLRSLDLITFADTDKALSELRAGRVYAAVVIPKNYMRNTLDSSGGTIELYLDETRYGVAGTIEAEITAFMSARGAQSVVLSSLYDGGGVSAAKERSRIIQGSLFSLGNPASSFEAFFGSTVIPGILQLGAILCFVTSLVREIYNKSYISWLATAGNSLSAAVVGKFAPGLFIYFLAGLWYVALFAGQGGWSANGSAVIWTFGAFLLVLAMAATGLLFFAVAPTWRMALVVTCGYAAPALPFSGFSLPFDSMGPLVRFYADLLPVTWFMRIQNMQWVLASPGSDAFQVMAVLFLLCLIPGALGLAVLRCRMRKLISAAVR
jgi:ABC-2 type transport system permease protein